MTLHIPVRSAPEDAALVGASVRPGDLLDMSPVAELLLESNDVCCPNLQVLGLLTSRRLELEMSRRSVGSTWNDAY